MPEIVNMKKLEESLAQFVIDRSDLIEASGICGVAARGQVAITTALTRWRAQEMNRGATPNEIANVMVIMFASAIQSAVTSTNMDRIQQLATINRMLKGIGEEIAAIRVGARDMSTYRVERTPGT